MTKLNNNAASVLTFKKLYIYIYIYAAICKTEHASR